MAPKKISKSSISHPTAATVTATAYRFHLPDLDIPKASLTEGTPIPPPQHSSDLPTPSGSPPQTPISTDSPNPLRSHPTSSHSLSRKFSSDALAQLNSAQKKPSPPRSNLTRAEPTADTTTAAAAAAEAGNATHVKRSYTSSPASSPQQPPSKRPHIRKLLSLKSLANLNRSSADLSRAPSYTSSGGYSVDIRSASPAPSTATNTSTISKLRKRSSGAFWRRDSKFGIGLGLVSEENGDHVMGGTEEALAGQTMRRYTTPPPMLPELDTLGGGLQDTRVAGNGAPTVKRQASGWFGGSGMFDGIGRK